MQLKSKLILTILLGAHASFCQNNDSTGAKIQLDNIEVDFLSSYYWQDGNHSPVTGGEGSEQLTNTAPAVVVKIPIDTVRTLTVDGGVDFYSSASSDNINNPFGNPNHVSGASASDQRVYVNLGIKKKDNQKHSTRGLLLGFSNEFDVLSLSAGGSLSKASKDENKELNLKLNYYFDNWKLIYPIELRDGNEQLLPTNQRHTINFSSTGSTVLNKRMALALTTDVVVQSGILSTPFHRVYFQGATDAVIEKLPSLRVKVPIGLRFNWYVNDYLKLRSFFRYYVDTWGIQAQTLKIEFPVKISNAFSFSPFYRYHQQTAATYFGEKGTHIPTDTYFTSDFDLSGLSSHKVGVGISITPLFGISRFRGIFRKDAITMFKSMDFRYAYYSRSDGFQANVFTLGLKFTVPNRKL